MFVLVVLPCSKINPHIHEDGRRRVWLKWIGNTFIQTNWSKYKVFPLLLGHCMGSEFTCSTIQTLVLHQSPYNINCQISFRQGLLAHVVMQPSASFLMESGLEL